MNIREFEKNLFKAIMNSQGGCVTKCMFMLEENMDLVQIQHVKAVYYCDCWECRQELREQLSPKWQWKLNYRENPNQLELIPEENFFDQFKKLNKGGD